MNTVSGTSGGIGANLWESHDGSVACPVCKYATIEVMWNDGRQSEETNPSLLDWSRILGFRLLKPF